MEQVKRKIQERVLIGDDGCWVWQGYVQKKRGLPIYCEGRSKRASATKASFEAYVGPVSDGLSVKPMCGNKLCVNPEHLELVNHGREMNPNSNKKTCVHGHSLADAYVLKNGHRRCRTCDKIRYNPNREGKEVPL